jgi:hypothetical protein
MHAFVQHPKEHSSHFPVKAMFMGVVTPPNSDQGFNGNIMLERISRMKTTKQSRSYSQRFIDTYTLNKEIRNGSWCNKCYNLISVSD